MTSKLRQPRTRLRDRGQTGVRASVLCLALLGMAFGGCYTRTQWRVSGSYQQSYSQPAQGYAEVYVAGPPPQTVVEFRPPAPGPGYVWVNGYWDWSGYDWYWTNGCWVAGRAGYAWVAPAYVTVNGSWVLRRGYWQGHGGTRDYHYGRPAQAWRGQPAPATGWRGDPGSNRGGVSGAVRDRLGTPSGPGTAPPAQTGGGISGRVQPGQPSQGGGISGRVQPGQPSQGGGWTAPPAQPGGGVAGRVPPGQPSQGGGWTAPPAQPSPGGGWSTPPSQPARPPGGVIGGMPSRPPTPVPNRPPATAYPTRPNPTPTNSDVGPGRGYVRTVPSPAPPQRYTPMPSSAPRQMPSAPPPPAVTGRRQMPTSPVQGPGRAAPVPAQRSSGTVQRGRGVVGR